ncbi:MAG: metallophosphoesterase [Myxococcota bacterium]
MGGSSIGEGFPGVTRAAVVFAAALLVAWVGCDRALPPGSVMTSLLAVGDTGARPEDPSDYPNLLAVGAALAAHHAERPAQALLLLGDNFYDEGLRRDELVSRVRANLVRPFCAFVALHGPRSPEVADACETAGADRPAVAIYALLGNHDHARPASPGLQRSAVPRFVSNWRLSPALAHVYELDGGVSLIALDSERLARGEDGGPLVEALRSARGPWRVLAAHRPMFALGARGDASRQEAYMRRVHEAIAESGVRVHLALAGHEHNLQVLAAEPPAPALHVVAGGGSDVRRIRAETPQRLAGSEALGYARIDLVAAGGEARLFASLYRVPDLPLRLLGGRWLVARWSVDRAGRVREE